MPQRPLVAGGVDAVLVQYKSRWQCVADAAQPTTALAMTTIADSAQPNEEERDEYVDYSDGDLAMAPPVIVAPILPQAEKRLRAARDEAKRRTEHRRSPLEVTLDWWHTLSGWCTVRALHVHDWFVGEANKND
jgi:hypothetical protein